MEFKSEIIQGLFNITGQTVRNWSTEFGDYLSDDAVGGDNKHRIFTEEDLKVFTLIAEMKAKRMNTDDIHATLASGARGELPDTSRTGIVPIDTAIKLSRLEGQNLELKDLLTDAQAQVEQLKLEKARLEGELTSLATVREQLSDEHLKRDQLMRQIGKLEAMLDMEKDKNKKNSS